MSKTWILFCATRPEWSEIKKNKEIQNFNLYQIGVGWKAVLKNVPPILNEWKKKGECFVIHFGVSGALDENLKTGDIVLPTQFVDPENNELELSDEIIQKAESLLKELQLSYVKGRLFSSFNVLKTPEEKKNTGSSRSAIAVDMETYPVAKMCQEKDIPFLSIRAIFDPLDWDLTCLSEADFIDTKGDLSTLKIAKKIIQSPRLLISLPKYQKALSVANKNLTRFIISALDKWG